MNLSQLRTLIWLRWRILLSSWRRMGIVGRVFVAVIAAVAAISMMCTIVAALILGLQLLPKAQPIHVMVVFDALVVAFLFFWSIGFLSELQRSEPLNIGKLLHLPMSLRGAFLLNYFSSFASLTIAFLGPVMVALSIAMAYVFGWKSLISFPLIAGFICLVTAITYQIRGWLAKLMSNPRRRRTVITGFTMVFILMFQLPNAINMYNMRHWKKIREAEQAQQEKWAAQLEDESLPDDVRETAKAELDKLIDPEYRAEKKAEEWKQTEETAKLWGNRLNTWIPFGWMPLGIYHSLQGSLWQGALGTVGLFGLAGLCLASSYRTTLRYYRKASPALTKSQLETAQRKSQKEPQKTAIKNGLAKPFPLAPPIAGTIARANLCSMLRAPEIKMMLLGPVIIVVIMCFPLFLGGNDIPAEVAPFIGGGMGMAGMIVSMPIFFNLFGVDRHAFRSYMLWPISGRDILLGKNLSLAPMLLPIALAALLLVQFFKPLGVFDFLSSLMQIVAAFIVLCILGNYFSSLFPTAIASSSMKKIQPRWQVIVAHMLAFFIIPIFLAPLLLPSLVAFLNRHFKLVPQVPLGFLLGCLILATCVWIYRYFLGHAGRLLEQRYQKVLAEVTRQAK